MGNCNKVVVGVISLLGLFVSGSVTYAAECNDVLRFGVWETESGLTKVEEANSFLNWFNRDISSAARSQSYKQEALGGTYAGYGADYKKNSGTSNWEEYSDLLSRLDSGASSYKQHIYEFVRKASQTIVDSWSNCINNTGFHISKRFTHVQEEVWIIFRFRKDNRYDPYPQIKRLDLPRNVSCPGWPNSVVTVEEGGEEIRCYRDKNAATIRVVVDTLPSTGSKIIAIPKIKSGSDIPEWTATISPSNPNCRTLFDDIEGRGFSVEFLGTATGGLKAVVPKLVGNGYLICRFNVPLSVRRLELISDSGSIDYKFPDGDGAGAWVAAFPARRMSDSALKSRIRQTPSIGTKIEGRQVTIIKSQRRFVKLSPSDDSVILAFAVRNAWSRIPDYEIGPVRLIEIR